MFPLDMPSTWKEYFAPEVSLNSILIFGGFFEACLRVGRGDRSLFASVKKKGVQLLWWKVNYLADNN